MEGDQLGSPSTAFLLLVMGIGSDSGRMHGVLKPHCVTYPPLYALAGVFSVRSSFDELEDGSAVLFPKKLIWNPCIPTKVAFFAW